MTFAVTALGGLAIAARTYVTIRREDTSKGSMDPQEQKTLDAVMVMLKELSDGSHKQAMAIQRIEIELDYVKKRGEKNHFDYKYIIQMLMPYVRNGMTLPEKDE